MSNILEKKKSESTYEYIKRVVQAKDNGGLDLDYSELAPHVFGKEYSSDVARRMHYGLRYLIKVIESEGISLQPTSQLDEIRKQIGELDIKRQQIKFKNQEFNKLKKQLIRSVDLADDVKDAFYKDGMQIVVPDYCGEYIEEKNIDRTMIVCLSDLHIGYVINEYKANKYNFEIAKKRLDKYILEIEKYCKLFEINKISVRGLGDYIEHVYMRGNQSQNTEMNQSEQIVNCTRLIYEFLTRLTKFAYVDYVGVAGNHDRSMGDRSMNIDGDNANVIINETLYTFNTLASNQRLEIKTIDYLQNDIDEEINGVNVKFTHGDGKLKNPKRYYDSECSMDGIKHDLIVKGHLHNFDITSQNNGSYVVGCGCLSGYNDYSGRFGCTTHASQTFIIVSNGEVEMIKDVQLQIV